MSHDHVYLAGPMRGIEKFNFPAFDHYAAKLRDQGLKVISPAEMDRETGFDEATPHTAEEIAGMMREFALRDVSAILGKCFAIALLPGWEKSTGAQMELSVSRFAGLEVLDATTGEAWEESVHEWQAL